MPRSVNSVVKRAKEEKNNEAKGRNGRRKTVWTVS
jgi:hypothetical protein